MTLPSLELAVAGWALRAWHERDADSLAENANDEAVWRNMSEGFPQPYTREIAEHWVAAGQLEFGGDNWAITFDDLAVGGCGVHVGSGASRCNAEIGYWLGRRYWGQGIATCVAAVLTERAFADPQVMRVIAPVHAYNPASMRALERNGFEREGLMRLSALKAGTVIDRVMMARYRSGVAGGLPKLPA